MVSGDTRHSLPGGCASNWCGAAVGPQPPPSTPRPPPPEPGAQCGHFEPLEVFSGLKRTCQVALDQHNARRRAQKARLRAAGAEAAASMGPSVSRATAAGPTLHPVAPPGGGVPPDGLGPLLQALGVHAARIADGTAAITGAAPVGASAAPTLPSVAAALSLPARPGVGSGADWLKDAFQAAAAAAGLGSGQERTPPERPVSAVLSSTCAS